MLGEPDVTLTDYGLAVECALFAYLVQRRGDPRSPLRPRLVLFFAAVGLGALVGGTVHGFFPDPASPGARVLWPVALLAIGLTALAAWAVGARIRFGPAVAGGIELAVTAVFVAYAALVAAGRRDFAVAVVHYLPAAAFLLVVLVWAYRRTRARPILIGAVGLVATFVAAAVQQGRVTLHPVYVSHNALYHAIQALALLMIFRAARWLVRGAC